MRLLDLFSGIGGFSLGLERAGFETVAFCEVAPACRHLLAHHWPGVPCYDDVRTLTAARLAADGVRVDAICGGFPCQDISFAGAGAGIEGERSGLWREYARLVRELRPRLVFVENVAALLGRGLGVVLGDLAALGYDAWWDCIPAAAVGAPHRRDRLWLVAYARGVQHEGYGDALRRAIAEGLSRAAAEHGLPAGHGGEADAQHPDANRLGSHRARLHVVGGAEPRDEQVGEPRPLGAFLADADILARHQGRACDAQEGQGGWDADRGGVSPHSVADADLTRLEVELDGDAGQRPAAVGSGGQWAAEPDVGRVAHGVPARVDRLHGLGNAVVPQIPELLGRAALAALSEQGRTAA